METLTWHMGYCYNSTHVLTVWVSFEGTWEVCSGDCGRGLVHRVLALARRLGVGPGIFLRRVLVCPTE